MIFLAIILLWYSKYIFFFNFQVKEVIAKVVVKAIVAKTARRVIAVLMIAAEVEGVQAAAQTVEAAQAAAAAAPITGARVAQFGKKIQGGMILRCFFWLGKIGFWNYKRKIENYLVDFRLNKTTIKLAWQPDQKIKFPLDSLGAGWVLRPRLCFRPFYALAPERSKTHRGLFGSWG